MEHISALLIALRAKAATGEDIGGLTARNYLEFLEHAVALARAAENEVPTSSAAKRLIELLHPPTGALR